VASDSGNVRPTKAFKLISSWTPGLGLLLFFWLFPISKKNSIMSEYEFKDLRQGGGRYSAVDIKETDFSKCRRSDGMYVITDCISVYTGASASDSKKTWERLTSPSRSSPHWECWASVQRRAFTTEDGQTVTLDVASYPFIPRILGQLSSVVTWST